MKYDIENLEFRQLYAEEIEIRVGSVISSKTWHGASLLLYQDARCAMDILDETVGSNNWQRDHKEVKGNMYCGISIWDENKKDWVTKWDCGVESNTEKQKGESSDAFKRAAVNWGIARALYSSPTIMVACDVKAKDAGKGYELADKYQFSGAKVSHIAYDDACEISELTIVDKNDVVLFNYPKNRKPVTMPTQEVPKQDYKPSDMITAEEAELLKSELEATNSDVAKFLAYIGHTTKSRLMSVDEMTKAQYVIAMKAIEAKKGTK